MEGRWRGEGVKRRWRGEGVSQSAALLQWTHAPLNEMLMGSMQCQCGRDNNIGSMCTWSCAEALN